MIPYLLVLVCALFLFVGEKWLPKNWPYYSFLVMLILFSGLRDMIGGFDVYIYSQVYESSTIFIFLFPAWEVGFRLYMLLLRLISEQREFFLFVTAAITLLLHFRAIRKNSIMPYFSIYIYVGKFFLFTFVYLRQDIAMGFMWATLLFMAERRYWKVGLLCLCAFLFHKSSLIFLPFVFLNDRRLNDPQLAVGIILFLIVFAGPGGTYIGKFLADATSNEKLALYADKGGTINYFTLFEVTVFSSLAFIFRKYFYQEKKTALIFNGFVLYIIVSVAGITNASFARLAWYYFIFVVLAFPYMYSFLADLKLRLAFKSVVLVYYAAVFIRFLIAFDNGDFMPYKTIFQDYDRHGMWEFMEYRKK